MFGRKAELLLKRSLKIYKTKRIVLNFKNKNDIILYKRENGTFVLHRVTGKKENAYIFRGDNQFSDEYGIKREQMIGKVTEIIRGDEVIPVNDIKHRMWAGFWVNTVFFRRVKRFCLKCRKKKQNLDKNKSC